MSYCLRDLPLPVKLVASVFLMAVGVGYTSAMVQLHMQDAKAGKPMPTVDDVVRKYTGKARYNPNDPNQRPASRLEALVTCPTVAISGASMSGAFTNEDRAKGDLRFSRAIKDKTPEQVEEIKAQRAGEQSAVVLWINLPDAERKASWTSDKFVVPAEKMPKAFTPALKDGDAIKIKSLLEARCVTCHSKGSDKEDVPLDTYDGLAKFMQVEAANVVDGWIKVEEPISITKLTQSTHAHLLSFSMLFSLTGLIFAFSSYPTLVRCILGPWVVLAVFADVSLWWLARLSDEWGPRFAVGIIGTGAVAGAGLFGQIVLSLFNMYGTKGKLVLGALFVLGGVIAGLIWVNKIDPALKTKAQSQQQQVQPLDNKGNGQVPKTDTQKPKPDEKQKKELLDALNDLLSEAADKKQAALQKFDTILGEARRKEIEQILIDLKSSNKETQGAAQKKIDACKVEWTVIANVTPKTNPSWLENLVTFPVKGPDGKILSMEETPWAGGEDGNMARAFYDKEKAFKDFMEDPTKPQAAKDKLMAERDGERRALIAWIRATDANRKVAYDTDAFPLPTDLTGKPITAKYLKNGKVAVTTLIKDRCLKCHGPDGKQYEEYPLDTYELLKKYMEPPAAPDPKKN